MTLTVFGRNQKERASARFGKPLLGRVSGGYTAVVLPVANRDVPRIDEGYQIERLVANYKVQERKLIREARKAQPDERRLGKLAAILSETKARIGLLQDKIEAKAKAST